MISAVRTASIDNDNFEAALEWSVRVATHVNETFGTNWTVYVNVTGNLREVHWSNDYESLAEYEEIGAKTQADEGFQALVAENRENGYIGRASLVDSLYRSVP